MWRLMALAQLAALALGLGLVLSGAAPLNRAEQAIVLGAFILEVTFDCEARARLEARAVIIKRITRSAWGDDPDSPGQ